MPHIDCQAVAGIRSAFAAKRHARIEPNLVDATFSLGGLLEIVAWVAQYSVDDAEGARIMKKIAPPSLRIVQNLWEEDGARSLALSCTGKLEIGHVSELTTEDKRWWDFLARFSAAMDQSGFPKGYPRSLAYTFHEMADNVRRHASVDPTVRPRALAAWHVQNGVAFFTVVDAGRGIKASLQTNPKWAALSSDRDALVQVVCNRATRIGVNTFGDGYNDVVQNFVGRNGRLALRSGEAELIAAGTVLESQVTSRPCPRFSGTRIAAWCAPLSTILPVEPAI